MTRSGFKRISAGLVAGALVALSAPVRAQVDDSSAAASRVLIEAAQAARDAGDRARALDLSLRAGRLRMSPSLRRFIAEEQSVLGEHVAAMTSAILCVGEVEGDPTLLARDEHLAACRALVETLSAQVGRVSLQPPDPIPAGLRIRIAGRDVPEALWGIAYVVVPGPVAVDAEAAPGRTFHRDLQVRAGDSARVPIELPPEPSPLLSGVPAAGPVSSTASPRQLAEASHRATLRRETAQSIGPWFVLGGAALAFAGAGVFGGLRRIAFEEARHDCEVGAGGALENCGPVGEAAHDRAVGLTIATNTALVVGGVAIIGAAAWWLAGRARQTQRRGMLGALPIAGGAAAVVTATF